MVFFIFSNSLLDYFSSTLHTTFTNNKHNVTARVSDLFVRAKLNSSIYSIKHILWDKWKWVGLKTLTSKPSDSGEMIPAWLYMSTPQSCFIYENRAWGFLIINEHCNSNVLLHLALAFLTLWFGSEDVFHCALAWPWAGCVTPLLTSPLLSLPFLHTVNGK